MAKPNSPAPNNAPVETNAPSQDSGSQSSAPSAGSAANVLPFKIRVLKQVSTNLLKLRAGMTAYVTITGKMELAKELKKKPVGDDPAKRPPTLIPVTNLETGEVQSIIAGSVLVDLLNDEYPKEGYVGKSFQISIKEKKAAMAGGGRSYNTYDVVEIAVEK